MMLSQKLIIMLKFTLMFVKHPEVSSYILLYDFF